MAIIFVLLFSGVFVSCSNVSSPDELSSIISEPKLLNYGAVLSNEKFIFRWVRVEGASIYELNIFSNDDSFEPIRILVPYHRFEMDPSLYEFNLSSTYFWRVRVKEPFISKYSKTQSFRILPGRCLFDFKCKVYSCPAIGEDGTIYVAATDSNLYALNDDGSLKWICRTGGELISSPVVGSDGSIYVRSFNNSLYSINEDGSLKWSARIEVPPRDDIWFLFAGIVNNYEGQTPALADDGTLYVGSWDNKLYAINSEDGGVKWSFETPGHIMTPPVIGSDGTIYVCSNENLVYAINPDGSCKWSIGLNYGYLGPMAIGVDGAVVLGSKLGFVKIYPDKRTERIQPIYGNRCFTPSIFNNGTTCIFNRNNLVENMLTAYSINGKYLWEVKYSIFSTASITLTADGTAYYCGNPDGGHIFSLFAINRDGSIKWFFTPDDYICASPIVGVDGTIYLTTTYGKLYSISGGSPIADGLWPTFQHDLRHTGRAD